MKPSALLLIPLLCVSAWADDDFASPPGKDRIRASLLALSKAESLRVYGQLDHIASDGSLTSVPIKKEILSHASIGELSGLLTSTRWDFMGKTRFELEDTAAYVHFISYEKGKRADEFRIAGGGILVHPWLGMFRAKERSVCDQALKLIQAAK